MSHCTPPSITTDELLAAVTFQPTVNLSAAKDLFSGLDMMSMEGKRAAVTRFLAMARKEGINITDDDNAAKIEVGTLVMGNSSLGEEELLSLAEREFGTVKSTRERLAGASTGTVCEGNEGWVKLLVAVAAAVLYCMYHVV
jgi:hypothetical protein